MDTEPLDLDFTTNTPIITRPFPISPNKDRILTAKVQELIENDLVEILEHDKNYVTNISNMFLVSHNSDCKREVMTGKRDPNKVMFVHKYTMNTKNTWRPLDCRSLAQKAWLKFVKRFQSFLNSDFNAPGSQACAPFFIDGGHGWMDG